eukprot:m.279248 g.279248  ORF g.279248 m.279248 type:complete len:202 (+) comp16157_c2_seq8:1307-1912(+)
MFQLPESETWRVSHSSSNQSTHPTQRLQEWTFVTCFHLGLRIIETYCGGIGVHRVHSVRAVSQSTVSNGSPRGFRRNKSFSGTTHISAAMLCKLGEKRLRKASVTRSIDAARSSSTPDGRDPRRSTMWIVAPTFSSRNMVCNISATQASSDMTPDVVDDSKPPANAVSFAHSIIMSVIPVAASFRSHSTRPALGPTRSPRL